MGDTWITQILALAIILTMVFGVRQLPTSRLGQASLRAPTMLWVAICLLGWIFIQFILAVLVAAGLSATLIGTMPQEELLAELVRRFSSTGLDQSIGFISALVAVFLAQVFLTRRPIRNLGFSGYRGWHWDVIMGLALGMIGFIPLLAIAMLAGQVQVANATLLSPALIQSLLTWLVVFVLVAISEEVLVRGYILQTVEKGWSTASAVVISSFLFGFLHLGNPSADAVVAITITASGVVLAYTYIITRSLWMPIAMHFAWNFTEGVVLGFPVSGLDTPKLLITQLPGSDVITGGSFGPEAGLVMIPIVVAQALILTWWVKARRPLTDDTESEVTQ